MPSREMPVKVILHADWFVISKKKYIKQLAFFAPKLGISGVPRCRGLLYNIKST